MRHEISETEYERLFSADIAELFEIYADSNYLAVVNTAVSETETAIIASLVSLPHEFYNLSEVFVFDKESRMYEFERAVERKEAEQRFYRYDTLADALAHANELLAKVETTF